MSVCFLLICCIGLVAATQVTLLNRNYKFDANGNLIDAHDGKLYYFDGKYYLYGTAYNCGFRWRTSNFTSPFCGFKTYSSTDLQIWQDEGYMFDASTHYWQEACADIAACFRPKVLQNPKTGKYVMWMNSGASTYSYTVFNSRSPTGPFVEIGKPAMPYSRGNSSYGNGDFGITIGPNGTGYIVYDTTPVTTGPSLFSPPNITYGIVQQLTPDYTATESSYIVTDLTNIEAWDMFYRDGWWYLTFGHICGYCDATDTSYIKSRDPLGPWLSQDRVYITNTSCGGQHNMVAQLPSGTVSTSGTEDSVWLYGSDLWTGDVNEGKAGSHWEPLTFLPDGSIAPLDCAAPEYLLDIEVFTQSDVEDVFANATVSSNPTGNYSWTCGFGTRNRNLLYQFLQAPKSGTVMELGIDIAQQANNADAQIYFGHVNDISKLFSPAGGVTSLWSQNYPVESIGWAFPMITGKPNVTVTEGDYYAIYMTSRAGSIPYCYLETETEHITGNVSEPPKSFLGEVQQGRYPLFGLLDREMRYYVRID